MDLGNDFCSFIKKSLLYSYYEKDAASRGGSRRPSIDGHTQLWNSSAENIEQVSNSYTAEQGKFWGNSLGMILTLNPIPHRSPLMNLTNF